MKIRLLHVLFLWVAGCTVAAMIGCGDDDPFNTDKPRRGPAMGVGGSLAPVDLDTSKGTVKPPPPAPAASTNPSPTGAVPPPPPPPPSSANAAPSPPPPGPQVERTEAGVGVETRKGHGYGGGLISTSIAAYFSIQERIAFDQVLYAMKLYKAENGHGPKSNEEFMEVIVKENMIKLPELRSPEHRYVYDPKTEELMVEQPR